MKRDHGAFKTISYNFCGPPVINMPNLSSSAQLFSTAHSLHTMLLAPPRYLPITLCPAASASMLGRAASHSASPSWSPCPTPTVLEPSRLPTTLPHRYGHPAHATTPNDGSPRTSCASPTCVNERKLLACDKDHEGRPHPLDFEGWICPASTRHIPQKG